AGAIPLGEGGRGLVAQPQANYLTRAGADRNAGMGARVRRLPRRVRHVVLAVDDVVVDAVLDVGAAVGHAEDPLRVGLVLGEQQLRLARAVEEAPAELGVAALHGRPGGAGGDPAQERPVVAALPRPLVAEPQR